MSVEDVKNIRSAYERMLADGSAFREVDMSMMTEPNVEIAKGAPLGDRVNETAQPRQGRDTPPEDYEHHTDYTEHDSYIQDRINRLRAKMKGGRVNEGGGASNTSKELLKLKKRVEKLEEALMIVMETHEKLLD